MAAGVEERPSGRGREGFPACRRLRRRREFLLVYDAGRKLSGRLAVVFVRPASGTRTRLGVTVTRRAGSAVVRNRLRRRVREVFRRSAAVASGPPVDLVVNLTPRAAEAPFDALRGELGRLFARAVGPAT